MQGTGGHGQGGTRGTGGGQGQGTQPGCSQLLTLVATGLAPCVPVGNDKFWGPHKRQICARIFHAWLWLRPWRLQKASPSLQLGHVLPGPPPGCVGTARCGAGCCRAEILCLEETPSGGKGRRRENKDPQCPKHTPSAAPGALKSSLPCPNLPSPARSPPPAPGSVQPKKAGGIFGCFGANPTD